MSSGPFDRHVDAADFRGPPKFSLKVDTCRGGHPENGDVVTGLAQAVSAHSASTSEGELCDEIGELQLENIDA